MSQRTIKFRAWAHASKVMFFPEEMMLARGVLRLAPNTILMQFTGLHDKNGKEIYDSDIVRYDGVDYVVRWSDVNGGFWVFTACPLNKAVAEDCEVIGNIYENGELLGKYPDSFTSEKEQATE